MRLGPSPTIYEINTAVWLERLARRHRRSVTLGDVPGEEWDGLAALAIDTVWLMGVWERSPVGRAAALAEPELGELYRVALPDVREGDVLGSPYCVRNYVVDERFGGPGGLAVARAELARRGVALILDFVPNHVAADHPWAARCPEYLIPGTEDDLAGAPGAFARAPTGAVFANGRDPYTPPWRDVLQLNAYSPALRAALADTVRAIAAQCDGVRCDMAMLMTNEWFGRTWGERAGSRPASDFWPELIERCRDAYPELAFVAEVYYDMEWELQQQGFDLCYDKRLYDRLAYEAAASVRAHLQADLAYQQRLIRFIENHDEPRAARTFCARRGRAAAVVMSTLPGARIYHDGQLDALRAHIPVQLGRGPDEPHDPGLRAFYVRLLDAAAQARADADWQLCTAEDGPPDTPHGHHDVLAWTWTRPRGPGSRHLVAVNFSPALAGARIRLPWDDLAGRTWNASDRLTDHHTRHPGEDLARAGFPLTLAPWESRLIALRPEP